MRQNLASFGGSRSSTEPASGRSLLNLVLAGNFQIFIVSVMYRQFGNSLVKARASPKLVIS